MGDSLHHELKTPLKALLGYSEILIEELTDLGELGLANDAKKIRLSGKKLLGVIDAIPHEVASGEINAGQFNEFEIEVASETGNILVVDDVLENRELLQRFLLRQGHSVTLAEDGFAALELAKAADVILLDVQMPGLNGQEVLQRLKGDETTKDIPVLMVSALDDLDVVVRCILDGAIDYLAKPYNPILLKARIGACLENKRLRDKERAYLEQLTDERERSETLLLNILPPNIAARLKDGEEPIVDSVGDVTVLFADIVGFTPLSATVPATKMIEYLDAIFTEFDRLAGVYGLQKLKTVGDCYEVVGGMPPASHNPVDKVADFGLALIESLNHLNAQLGTDFHARVGLNLGPVIAGVLGKKKLMYDVWGDAVNVAQRMEAHGVPDRVMVSEAVRLKLEETFDFEARMEIDIKGKGIMPTSLLIGRKGG